MTYQAYLDTIKTKTGKTPEDFRRLAAQKSLTKYPEIMAWLKEDFGLGVAPVGRFEAAGSWNRMVTDRVRISAPDQIDAELVAWLKHAYDRVNDSSTARKPAKDRH